MSLLRLRLHNLGLLVSITMFRQNTQIAAVVLYFALFVSILQANNCTILLTVGIN